jgi:hypothetical protein
MHGPTEFRVVGSPHVEERERFLEEVERFLARVEGA